MNLQRHPYFSVSSEGVPIRNIADYSPFGVQLDGRTIQGDFYRRGFNGMEKDDEVKGGGNSYDYGARILDPRVGRWLSLDPLTNKYPDSSPYNYAGNNPIYFIDPNGEFLLDVHHRIAERALSKVDGNIVSDRGILHEFLSGNEYLNFRDGFVGKYGGPLEGGISDPDLHHSGSLWSKHDPKLHFDNMNSSQILSNLNYISKSVDKTIKNYNNGGSAYALGYEIGKSAHAIQDLYAHSNYVEIYSAVYPNQKDITKIPTLEEALNDNQYSDFAKALKNNDPKKGLVFKTGKYPHKGEKDSHKKMNHDVGKGSQYAKKMDETKDKKVDWYSKAAEEVAERATVKLLEKVDKGTN